MSNSIVPPNAALDYALAYAALGWSVFPLPPGQKAAAMNFRNATTDRQQIERWWGGSPNSGIGLYPHACGLAVIDVDVKNGDGMAQLEALQMQYGELPSTLTAHTPSGGTHLVFRCNVPLGNYKIAPDVDIRCANGYIAVEPTTINDTTYQWLDWWDILEGGVPEIADLPQWVVDLSLAAQKEAEAGAVSADENAPEFAPIPSGALLSLGARFQQLLNDAPKVRYRWEGGRDDLADKSGSAMDFSMVSMLKQAGFTYSETVTLLADWEHGSQNPQRQTERYWQRAWSRSKAQEPVQANDVIIALGTNSAPTAVKAAPPPAEIETPPNLLNPPGMVGEVARWVEETARKPQPQFSVQAALAFACAVLGRRYVTDQRNWPSLYFMNIGKSASGKEHAKWAIEKALEACQLDHLIGPASYTSDSGLLSTLIRQPSHITVIDEFGKVLEDASIKNGSRAASTMRALMEAWGRCDGTMRPQGYSTFGLSERDIEKLAERTVRNPALSLLAMTTPETLFETIGMAAVRDGFLNRFLIVETEIGRQPSRSVVPSPLPDEIIQWVERVRDQQTIANPDSNAQLEATPTVIPIGPDAVHLFDQFELECLELMDKYEKDGLAEMFGRTREIAMRMSLIIAVGCESAEVEAEHAAWSINYARYYALKTVERLKTSVGDSEFDALKKQVYDIILRAGERGCTARDIARASRRFARIDKREQENVLESLQYLGEIALVSQTLMNGRTRTSWVAVANND